jgi:hypothetical protein
MSTVAQLIGGGGVSGQAITLYHAVRLRLDRFASSWNAALPAGLDPGPGQVATDALDRDDQCRRQARSQRDTRAAMDALVERLADGEIDLDQASDEMLAIVRLRDRAEIADLLVERVGLRILQKAARELETLGDRLITEYIRPALAKSLEELGQLAPRLEGIRTDEQAIKAPKGTAQAWARAVELVGHVDALRRAGRGFTTPVDSNHYEAFRWWTNPAARPKREGRGPTHPVRTLLDSIAAGAGPTFHTAEEVAELSRSHDRAEAAASRAVS